MDIEESIKHKACNVDYFATCMLDYAQELAKYADALKQEANHYQGQMAILKEKNWQLVKALKRICECKLIVKPTGTIYMDDKEEETLRAFIEETLKTWGVSYGKQLG